MNQKLGNIFDEKKKRIKNIRFRLKTMENILLLQSEFKNSYMYAIVEIAGQQFKVTQDQRVIVHRLDAAEGDKLSFDNVLLMDDNGTITVGAPAIDGASVEASINRHLKGDRVIVFKKKRRKGYRVRNGHRQSFTEITINKIGVKKVAKKKAAETEEAE